MPASSTTHALLTVLHGTARCANRDRRVTAPLNPGRRQVVSFKGSATWRTSLHHSDNARRLMKHCTLRRTEAVVLLISFLFAHTNTVVDAAWTTIDCQPGGTDCSGTFTIAANDGIAFCATELANGFDYSAIAANYPYDEEFIARIVTYHLSCSMISGFCDVYTMMARLVTGWRAQATRRVISAIFRTAAKKPRATGVSRFSAENGLVLVPCLLS